MEARKDITRRIPRWVRVGVVLAVVLLSAELAAESLMRLRATQQFPKGYCGFERVFVPSMIAQAVQKVGDGRFGYARLTAGEQGYLWSFKTFSFEPEARSCREPGAGWCWCLAVKPPIG